MALCETCGGAGSVYREGFYPCPDCSKLSIESENKRLREGLRLYIALRNKKQFTEPKVLQEISEITGKEYKEGHSIGGIIRDLEGILI